MFAARCSRNRLLTTNWSRFLECFSPFVASWTAPSASGWDEFAGRDSHPSTQRAFHGTHNNLSERTLRPAAIGRKNWLFVGNDQGGRTAAMLFTKVAGAKANGADPYAYLR